jgi:hypothetical protein
MDRVGFEPVAPHHFLYESATCKGGNDKRRKIDALVVFDNAMVLSN